MSDSSTHVVEPTVPHTHTIILLHGRGSTATQFASEFFESQASDSRFLPQIFSSYKWVFPCATFKYATTDQKEMHQWFDMESVQNPCYDPNGIQIAGMQESVKFIREMIEDEAAEVGGLDKVFLGGISQGCATAITALLTMDKPLAGFIGFCGWCPFSNCLADGQDYFSCKNEGKDLKRALSTWLQQRLPKEERPVDISIFSPVLRTPVLLEHAKDDSVVPPTLGQDLRDKLARLNFIVEWCEYEEGGHWINEPRGIDDLVRFLESKAKK